jgi:eukaryotic-like serine/threonine-protein kinase
MSVRWRPVNTIGAGGFCRVHAVRKVNPETNETEGPEFALKTVQDQWENDDDVVRRFQREVRLMADELSHPNIVEVIARNVSAKPPWFVMPKADGNLRDELDSGRFGDKQWVSDTFRQVLEGFAYAHSRKVIHRDLKPQNVLILDGTPLICDFGLGRAVGSDSTGVTRTNQWAGTEPYMAPEQFDAMKETDERADVFSLGKLLCEMLTGDVPPVEAIDGEGIPEPFRYFVFSLLRYQAGEQVPGRVGSA